MSVHVDVHCIDSAIANYQACVTVQSHTHTHARVRVCGARAPVYTRRRVQNRITFTTGKNASRTDLDKWIYPAAVALASRLPMSCICTRVVVQDIHHRMHAARAIHIRSVECCDLSNIRLADRNVCVCVPGTFSHLVIL